MSDFINNVLLNPFGITLNLFWQYAILIVISEIAFRIAWNAVGKMYRDHTISGRLSGSAIHWTIRIGLFILLWVLIRRVISACKFISDNLYTVLIIAVCCIGIVLICFISIMLIRKIKSKKS